MAAAVAWPPFLTYSNYFGSESVLVGLGLVATGCFWRSLSGHVKAQRRMLSYAGLVTGVALATKTSFVPVFIALLVSTCSFHFDSAWRSIRSGRRFDWRPPAIFVGATASSYLLATVPIWRRIPRVWMVSLSRDESQLSNSSLGSALVDTAMLIFRSGPVLALLVVGLMLGAAACAVSRLALRGRRRSLEDEEFSFVPASVFVSLIFLALTYTAIASVIVTPGAEAGVRLRNMTPTFAAVPLLSFHIWKT